jgi:KipI family sensor histidine kinase inhibitor
VNILPFGDRAILAEFDSLEATMEAFRLLDRARLPGVLELVPAARTVLVTIDPARLSLRAAEQWVLEHWVAEQIAEQGGEAPAASGRRDPATPDAAPRVTIPVRYDGPDLAATADLLGVTPAELVSRHSLAEWRCAFIGFAPGFAYLAGGGLQVPRRATSRESVPFGSVGLAGEFTGIYPRSSPGGWQLIGTTDAVLWDVDRNPPSLIAPGMSVRFEVVEP